VSPTYILSEGTFKFCDRNRDGEVKCDSSRVKLSKLKSGVWKASFSPKSSENDFYFFRSIDINNEYALVELEKRNSSHVVTAFLYMIIKASNAGTIELYNLKLPSPAIKALNSEFPGLNLRREDLAGFNFDSLTQDQIIKLASKVVSRNFWSQSLFDSTYLLIPEGG